MYRFQLYIMAKQLSMKKTWALKTIVTIEKEELFKIHTIQTNPNEEKPQTVCLNRVSYLPISINFFVEDTLYGSSLSKEDCGTTRSG